MVVISVSLSGKELSQFDLLTERMGFSSRSDAIREALKNFISENRWKNEDEGSESLLVSLIYDDCRAHKILDIIHDHSDAIHSSSHTHIDHKCVDQIVLKGEVGRFKEFLSSIAAVKDVRVKRIPI